MSHPQPPSLHDSLPAAKAQENLLGYFEALPTHAVNADHDASRPPHPHPGAMPSSLVQYGDKKASEDMEKYYDSVPSHNVNAFHDAPSHVRGKARFATDAEAQSDMDSYYDSIPTNIREQGSDQTAHKAGDVKQQSARKADVKESGSESVSPAIHGSGEADKGDAAVAALQKETVSVIQDFGDADKGDAAVAAVRKAAGYDTNLGPTNKLKTAVMEETPGGPVETSIARSTGSTSTMTSTKPEAGGAQATESAAMTPWIANAAGGRRMVDSQEARKQPPQQQQQQHVAEAEKGVEEQGVAKKGAASEEQGLEKKGAASLAVPHPAAKHHMTQAKEGVKRGAKRGSEPSSTVKAVIAEAAESHLSGLKQKYGNAPGTRKGSGWEKEAPGKGGFGVGGGVSMQQQQLNVRNAHEMHRRARKVGGGAPGSKHLSQSVGKMVGLGLCNVVGVGCV
jgi:hypothetical protein